MSWIRAIATDLDGTIAEDDVISVDALDAIKQARYQGLSVVLVTGRTLQALREQFPGLVDHFDAVVAENGAVLLAAGRERPLAEPVSPALAQALSARGVPFRMGHVLLALSAAADEVVLEEIGRLGLDAALLRNRGELMVLPSGVSKGSGLLAALELLRVSRHNTIAIGDAENDHAMFECVELGVATANAVPALKDRADLVLAAPDGRGVAGLLNDFVLGRPPTLPPGRRRILIGIDDHSKRVTVPANPATILIVGGSGRGKSYLAGLMVEQLIQENYQVVVLDPEGEQKGLTLLPGVRVIHGGEPDLRHRVADELTGGNSVIIDLAGIEPTARRSIEVELVEELGALRAITGLPHWIVLDEAHVSLGPDGSFLPLYDPASTGFILVTYQPDKLPAHVLAQADVVISASPPVDHMIGTTEGAACGRAKAVSGQATLLLADTVMAPQSFTVLPRITHQERHQRKYAEVVLPAGRGFRFRPSHGSLPEARSLLQFRHLLSRVDGGALKWHVERGDLSRWLAEVVQDRELAEQVGEMERALLAREDEEIAHIRRDIDVLIAQRYFE